MIKIEFHLTVLRIFRYLFQTFQMLIIIIIILNFNQRIKKISIKIKDDNVIYPKLIHFEIFSKFKSKHDY